MDYGELFLRALRSQLPSTKRYSDKQLISKIGKEKYEESVDLMTDFVLRSCGDLGDLECYALFAQVLRCLSTYMQTQLKIPVTLNTLINNSGMIEYATNLAFPGYAESGFLKTVISPRSLSVLQMQKAS